jgi:hypothetical protein
MDGGGPARKCNPREKKIMVAFFWNHASSAGFFVFFVAHAVETLPKPIKVVTACKMYRENMAQKNSQICFHTGASPPHPYPGVEIVIT